LTGILFVLKTGIAWEDLRQEMGCGSGMTCWRRLQAWHAAGVWSKLHQALLDWLGKADEIGWSRASQDSASLPAPRGRCGRPDPTNRGESETKRHLVVDRNGLPLSVTLSAVQARALSSSAGKGTKRSRVTV
jgi:transposase